MSTTWILVAHRSGARIFERTGAQPTPREIIDLDHPEGRLRERDLASDRPGRVHDRIGDQRHGVSREESAVEHLAIAFTRELANYLRDARLQKRYEHLVLVAGPKFLGHLRDALDSHTTALVSTSLHKDLQDIPEHELLAHLEGVLDAIAD